MAHASLFQPFRLKSLTLANRFVMAPMTRSFATAGVLPAEAPAYYGKRAAGGVGLIISEGVLVDRPAAGSSPGEPHFHGAAALAMWSRVVGAVHEAGGRMAPQLWHKGVVAPRTEWRPGAPFEGPSGIVRPGEVGGIAMSEVDIADTIAAFARAAADAQHLGFDCVEIHGAHGYLLHQFLSPLSNRRTDEYGGTMEKRRRFPLEVFEACRAVWPRDKALGIRLSATDWVEGGLTIEDTIETARQLKSLGCDFVDVSSGGNSPAQKIAIGPGYHVGFSARVRKEAGIKTWAVGIITEPEQAERIVESGEADCTAHARAFMVDPRWAWNAARALGVSTPPLPLPAARGVSILPFMPQAVLAKAAE